MTAVTAISQFFISILLVISISACAPAVIHSPAAMTPVGASAAQPVRSLAKQVNISLDTGYSRALPTGSQWIKVGTLPQGDVYKRNQEVFTLEGTHVHEAYLVVAGNILVGFYLPVERSFSTLSQKAEFNFN